MIGDIQYPNVKPKKQFKKKVVEKEDIDQISEKSEEDYFNFRELQ